MKKTFTIAKLAMALLFAVTAFGAKAADQIKEGVQFAAPYETVMEYVPSASGILTITMDQNWYGYMGALLYTSYVSDSNYTAAGLEFNGTTATCSVEGGKTYYFYQGQYDPNGILDKVTMNVTFTLQAGGEQHLALSSIYPDPGQAFTSDNQDLVSGVVLEFSPKGVTYGTAVMKYTDNEDKEQTVSLTVTAAGQNVSIGGGSQNQQEIYNNLNNIKTGTKFYIVISGFKYNDKPVTEIGEDLQEYVEGGLLSLEDGVITITYSKPSTIFKLESSNFPSELTSFLNPGSANGTATLTYNLPVKMVGTATLIFRNTWTQSGIYEDLYAQWDIPSTIDGTKVTLNFTGTDFSKLANYSAPANVHIFLTGVYSEDGQMAEPINQTVKYNTASAETPATPMSAKATTVDMAQYYTAPENVTVTWDYQQISLTSDNGYAWAQVGAGAPVQLTLTAVSVPDASGVTPSYTNAVELTLPDKYTSDPGVITFTLPQSMVKNTSDEVNAEATFSYTLIAADSNYTASIKNGESYLAEDLSSVSFTWNVDELVEGYSKEKVTIQPANGEATDVETTLTAGALTMNLSTLTPAVYTLNIPAGYVWIQDGVKANPQISVIFTVASSEKYFSQGAVIMPEDGNPYVTEIETVELLWNEEISAANDAVTANLLIQGQSSPVVVNGEIEFEDGVTVVTFDVSEYSASAAYQLQLEEGMLKNTTGQVNMAQTVEYTLLPVNDDYVFTPDFEAPLAPEAFANGIILSWPEASKIEINDYAGFVEFANNRTQYNVNANAVVIPTSEELETGTYTLAIPATLFVIDGTSLNPAINITYIVDETLGVKSITVVDGNDTIYNLQGMKVNANNLKAGIYIINGKKVLVK